MLDDRPLNHSSVGGLITITLNRPPYNILNIALMTELNRVLELAEQDETAKALLITASGDKYFSAGADVADHLPDKVEQMLELIHGIVRRLMAFPVPTIAALNGSALGGGCELVLACDMAIAVEDAKLGQPEIKLGVFPPIAVILLPKILPLPKAMELILGGASLDALEAQQLGLLNHVFSRSRFAQETQNFLAQFLSLSRTSLIHAKKVVREAYGKPFSEALPLVENVYLQELMASPDALEGLIAFMEKRKPSWKREKNKE